MGEIPSLSSKVAPEIRRAFDAVRQQLKLTNTGASITYVTSEEATGYTKADLETDLAEGVNDVLMGLGSEFQLVVDTTAGWIVASHKDSNYGTPVGEYSGTLRTGLLVSSSGIMAGYNRKSDGVWQNSFVIDGATGNATFTGTINATAGNFTGTVTAGSIITNSVTVDGTALGTIKSNASLGATAYNSLGSKLESSSSYILSGVVQPKDAGGFKVGDLTWNSVSGAISGGSGIAITEYGLVGAKSGVTTFTIDSSGNATFKGDLVTGGNVTCTGLLASQSINMGGTDITIYPTSIFSGTSAQPSGYRAGVYAYSNQTSGIGLAASATGGIGYGVVSYGKILGGYFTGQVGLMAVSSVGGSALQLTGSMSTNNSTRVANLNADYLDGYHASSFALQLHSHTIGGLSSHATDSVKMQYSVNGFDWANIYMKRYDW